MASKLLAVCPMCGSADVREHFLRPVESVFEGKKRANFTIAFSCACVANDVAAGAPIVMTVLLPEEIFARRYDALDFRHKHEYFMSMVLGTPINMDVHTGTKFVDEEKMPADTASTDIAPQRRH